MVEPRIDETDLAEWDPNLDAQEAAPDDRTVLSSLTMATAWRSKAADEDFSERGDPIFRSRVDSTVRLVIKTGCDP